MEIKLYKPVTEKKANQYGDHEFYREAVTITNEEEFVDVIKYDHCFARYKNERWIKDPNDPQRKIKQTLADGHGWANQENFEECDVLWVDIDNDQAKSESPEDMWITLQEFQKTFQDVKYALYTSKSHMKLKSETFDPNDENYRKPRPKMHIVFPLSKKINTIDDVKQSLILMKELLKNRFGEEKFKSDIDQSVFEPGRQFFGSGESIVTDWHDDGIFVDDLLGELSESIIKARLADGSTPEDRREKDPIADLMRNMVIGAIGTRHNVIRDITRTLAVRLHPQVTYKSLYSFLRPIADNWDPPMTKDNIADFNKAFDGGWSQYIDTMTLNEEEEKRCIAKYDSKYVKGWWGKKVEVFDTRIIDKDVNEQEGFKNISDIINEDRAVSTQNVVWGKVFDPKYKRVVAKKLTEIEFWNEKTRPVDKFVYRPALPFGRVEEDGKLLYNMCQESEIKADKTKPWDLIHYHIKYVICKGNDEHYEFLMDLLAIMILYPEVKLGIALALKGSQGSGKNTLFEMIKALLGITNIIEYSSFEQLTNNFNFSAANKRVCILNEALWGKSNKSRQILKSKITEQLEFVEPKGVDGVMRPNFKNYLISSNEDHHTPVERMDRRYFVLEVSDEKVGQIEEYFKPLRKQMFEEGGLSRLLYELKQREVKDISRFQPIPWTDEKVRQLLYHLETTEEHFIYQVLKGDSYSHNFDYTSLFLPSKDVKDILARDYGYDKSARRVVEIMKKIFGDNIVINQRRKMVHGWVKGTEMPKDIQLYRDMFEDYCGVTRGRLFS